MSALRARRHLSSGHSRPPGRRSSATAIAGTVIVAVLAVVVVVLAYRVGHRHTGPTIGDFSELEARVDELAGQMNAMQATVDAVARQAKATLAKAKRNAPAQARDTGLAACLVQVQREVDDLQAYLAYRTPPRRDRVSGSCLALLQPRFKG